MSRLQHFHLQSKDFRTAISFWTSIGAVFMLSLCSCRTPGGVMSCASTCATANVPCVAAAPSTTSCGCGSVQGGTVHEGLAPKPSRWVKGNVSPNRPVTCGHEQCSPTRCNFASCGPVKCSPAPCQTVPCQTVPCQSVPRKAVPCQTVPCQSVPRKAVPCPGTPCRPSVKPISACAAPAGTVTPAPAPAHVPNSSVLTPNEASAPSAASDTLLNDPQIPATESEKDPLVESLTAPEVPTAPEPPTVETPVETPVEAPVEAPADITAESATEAPVDRVPMEEVETETPESLDAALNAEVPEASTLPETVDMSEVPETPEVPVNESVLPELPELPEIPAESGTVPEVPEAVEIPEIPGELPEIPAEPSSEPMEELLPLEDVTPLETGKMMRPRQNVPGGARVLEVPRKGETATSSASSVEQDNKSKKSGSAIKFQKFSPEGPALELEIEDASHFGRNISPQKRMFMEPSGKKVVMSPLLQVNAEMKASKSVSKSASVQDSVQSSAQDSTQVSVPVATRWNISAETLRAAANIANNASKVDYGIRLTAAEMPVAVGNSAENNGNAGNNGNAVSKTPGEIVMQSDAAIAARLIERPSYAEPADEYIIDTKQPASRRDLGNAKKMKVGGAEVEDSWQADTQDQSGTFIYYNNAQGRSTVQSPDPVYIYAPRFRSVRQIVDLNVDSQVMTTGDIYTPEEIFIQGRNTGTDTAKQNAQTHTESGRTTLIQAQGAMGSGQVDGAIGVQSQNQEVVIAQENRTIVGPQASAGKARAVTASGLVEISAWTKTDGLQVFIEKESASAAVRNEFAPSLYTVKEGENKQDVRIYKVSSKTSAKPGETVDFIIYFENTGTAPVGNITLVDNLPARLEIVEDSAESSVDSSFTYEVNGTGSQTLRWEITQPLYAGEKGAVKFRALVR